MSNLIRKPPCRNGATCPQKGCSFEHPACPGGYHCVRGGCSLWHPIDGICIDINVCRSQTYVTCLVGGDSYHKTCKFGSSCTKRSDSTCEWRHSSTDELSNLQLTQIRVEKQEATGAHVQGIRFLSPCLSGAFCQLKNCRKWHPVLGKCQLLQDCYIKCNVDKRKHQLCMNGLDCYNKTKCFFGHPVRFCTCKNPDCLDEHEDALLRSFYAMMYETNYNMCRSLIEVSNEMKKSIYSAKIALVRATKAVSDQEVSIDRKAAQELVDTIHEKVAELSKQWRTSCEVMLRTWRNVTYSDKEKVARLRREIFKLKAQLPALAKRLDFEKQVEESKFVVVVGQTGSGKSTQLPQYIAEMERYYGKKVLVTQPRKLAAVSLAKRVALEFAGGNERFAKVGLNVGYRTGGYSLTSKRVRVEYTTETYLLNQLMRLRSLSSEKAEKYRIDLSQYAAVIIDEAHERNVTTDLLLGLLKQNESELRVIVTSATLNANFFSKFFYDCPVVEIPGRMFPVEVVHGPYSINQIVDSNVVQLSVNHVAEIVRLSDITAGDILCFLPGQGEVEEACRLMTAKLTPDNQINKIKLFPLYGKQTPEDQEEVFKPVGAGKRKIVFATDVAETSITIDGVRFVVDCGLAKDTVYDSRKNMTTLKVVPISQSSATQRKGRAGRTAPGVCHRLYSADAYEVLEESPVPEIKRRPLHLAVSRLIALQFNDPNDFFWLDDGRPSKEAIDAALADLEVLGMVTNCFGVRELSEIGEAVVALQVDPTIGCMLYKACEQGYGEVACEIAGLMSVGNSIFWRGGDEKTRAAADSLKRTQFNRDEGDISTNYRVFREWSERRKAALQAAAQQPPASGEAAQTALVEPVRAGTAFLKYSSSNRPDDGSVLPLSDDENEDKDKLSPMARNDDGTSDGESETGGDAADVAEFNDEFKDQAAQQISLKDWTKERYLNNKMLFMARSAAKEYQRTMQLLPVWQARQQDGVIQDDSEIQRLAMRAMLLNIAVRTGSKGNYHALLTDSVGVVHPGSAVASKNVDDMPKWLCFHDILQTSRVFLNQVVRIDPLWLRDENRRLFDELEQKTRQLNVTEIRIRNLSPDTRIALLGKFGAKKEALAQRLGCELQLSYEGEDLIAYCIADAKERVESALCAEINDIRQLAKQKIAEDLVIGGTRLVWGCGAMPIDLLGEKHYISVNIRNLPKGYDDAELRKLMSRFGEVRNCTLISGRSVDSPLSAHITYSSPTQADRAVRSLIGEVSDGNKTWQISPGGIRSPGMFHELSAKLTLSFALGSSTGYCNLVYASAEDVDKIRRSDMSQIHPGIVVTFPNASKLNQKPNKFMVTIGNLPKNFDEQEVMEKLDRFQLPKPMYCSVKRKEAEEASHNDEQRTADFVRRLIAKIPNRFKVVSYTSFRSEGQLRGGLNGFFASVDDAELARSEMRSSNGSFADELIHDQPLRLNFEFSQRLAVHRALWTADQAKFEEIVRYCQNDLGMTVVVDQGAQSAKAFVSLDFKCCDAERLTRARKLVLERLEATIYQHEHKHLLLTRYGRERLLQLAANLPHLHWDNKTSTIRIYGEAESRQKAKMQLDLLIDELAQLILGESLLIKGHVRDLVFSDCDRLKQQSGCVDLRRFRGQLLASGTEAAIGKLKRLLIGKVIDRAVNALGDDLCGVCFCPDGDAALETCGHKYHKDCFDHLFTNFAALPLTCSRENCNAELTIDDIKRFCSEEQFCRLKEIMVASLLNKRPQHFRRCLQRGCEGILLLIVNANKSDEARAGGNVSSCDQCMQTFCVGCSETERATIVAHIGSTCQQACLQRQQLLDAERAREELLRRYRRHVLEELCFVYCPGCKGAIFDFNFNQCFALTCENPICCARFCGLCLWQGPSGPEVHKHVAQCEKNPQKGSYFLTAGREVFTRVHNRSKTMAIVTYLKDIEDIDLRRRCWESLQEPLKDDYNIVIDWKMIA